MPQAACSAGIGRRHRCSHVTLTVTLAVYESVELDLKSKWWKEKQDTVDKSWPRYIADCQVPLLFFFSEKTVTSISTSRWQYFNKCLL